MDLSGVDLSEANLQGAMLADTDLNQTKLVGANLREADLEAIRNWNQIGGMESTNLCGVQNPPEGFLEWAKEQGAVIQE